MKTFSDEVREEKLKKANYQCENFQEEKCHGMVGLTFHHIIPNTKPNQKKYGKKLQSKENCCVLCLYCHDNYSSIDWLKEKKKKLEESWEENESI